MNKEGPTDLDTWAVGMVMATMIPFPKITGSGQMGTESGPGVPGGFWYLTYDGPAPVVEVSTT